MKNATLKRGLKATLIAGGVCLLVPSVYGQGIGLRTLDRMLVPTDQKIERGSRVYADQCASCHGDQGRGGAPVGQALGAQGFVGTNVERSDLMSIYQVVARGLQDAEHPVFNNLFFQDQWAVSHYVHSLIDSPRRTPRAVEEQLRFEAQFGVCDPEIREGIADLVEPTGAEQVSKGGEIYAIQCASCHGAQGRGDGPAAAALQPPPRNFAAPADQWTQGTSALAIFNVLTLGIEGTSMPAYAHLPEEERWALTHYVRTELMPEEIRTPATEEQITEVCRALSAPPRPPTVDIDAAMDYLVADAAELRRIRRTQYGDVLIHQEARAERGHELYVQSCASCHGAQGSGVTNLGPYGAFPPFLFLNVSALEPAAVGGTYVDVAERVVYGPHATLPNMAPTAFFTDSDWRDLQAYIARFDGYGRDTVRPMPAPGAAQPAEEEAETAPAEEAAPAPQDTNE
jgi:cytochrome c